MTIHLTSRYFLFQLSPFCVYQRTHALSQVTDHCAIDLDQRAIETELDKQTNDSFALATRIYNDGAYSKLYAKITLSSRHLKMVHKGAEIIGKDASGQVVHGVAFSTYSAGNQVIRFQYATSDQQASYDKCQVGALGANGNVAGCLAATGEVTIGSETIGYTYSVNEDNKYGRTIAGFSTQAGAEMRTCDAGCPHTDFTYFSDYYGVDDYGHEWVSAALSGSSTSFTNGNANFTNYDFVGRAEAAKKGTVFLNIFMYVIREFEDALVDCVCIGCRDDPVHAWDAGVCFYTGSIEGKDGLTDEGKLLHQLADKMCANFKTCGKNGNEVSGTSKLNIDLLKKYNLGKQQLQKEQCDDARITTAEITKLLYIPFIQGTLRCAYQVGASKDDEKAAAEGATFAAAVLPRVHAIDPAAATTIYNNMKVGATSTDFKAVKKAFESVYSDLGITCADIGGLWNDAKNEYFEGMEPCEEATSAPSGAAEKSIAAMFVAALLMSFS